AAGVAFVPLDEVEEAAAVVPAVLEAAGVGGLVSSVADDLAALADLDLLLVLDNCEHVLDAVADFASRVGGSRLTLLATSRQSIGVEGERVVAVAPLMADGPQLFAARAASAGVDTDPDHPAVARIVANVDGLPLAIEMAAALTPSLGLDDLVELTAATPSTMRSPIRGAAKRQRHLGALIDWSLDRLVDVDRLAVGDLAVFEGTFTREHAAALIGSQRLTTLPELVDRSLLVADTSDGRARYRMLRTVRERVWQRHDDREATSERHADIVSTFVGLLDDGLQTDDEATVHGELLERYADLRSAHAWARRRRPELAVGLTACTYNWAHSRQIADPFRWADELGAGGHGGEPAVALAMAQARFLDGKADEALALLGQVVDRSTGRIRLAVHETIGDINLALGRLDESIDTNVELVRLSEKADDIHYAVIGLVGQAIGHRYGGRRSEAERLLDVIGSVAAVAPTDRGWCRYARAEVIGDEDVEGAADDFRVATELADTVGNRFLGGVARVSLSALRARAGAPEASIDDLVETIVEWRQRGMRSYLETSLRNLVILLHRVERDREAAELLGALDRWAEFDTFGDEAR
ncbi:MAG: hypothetical protein KDB37_20515, partial [Ilumatobacter sp.]|nr:hypothetical protein [Ilumatobacter sp.]